MNKAIFCILLLWAIGYPSERRVLKRYDYHHLEWVETSINVHYHGPLFATGATNAEMNLQITDMPPIKVCTIESNRIVLLGDETYPEEIYEFSKVKNVQGHPVRRHLLR
ncbi:MAG: hypothetical protein JW863_18745 [Chitinispirillaceae bacterium]|nr:hypothetical protein [Chitinispirillaceae bacterium]